MQASDTKRVLEKCQRVFSQMDALMARPLYFYRWRFLKPGTYYKGRSEAGKFLKIPKSRKLNMIMDANGREVLISTNREKSHEITRETDGKPIPREKAFHRYDLFEAVRSRMHIREGHKKEVAALKDFLSMAIQIHDSLIENRRELADSDLLEFKCQVEQMIPDSVKWESAYKLLGKFKLEDVPLLLEEAVGNRSRLSIALTKLASLMERVSKWRPRQMNGIDRFNYKRECVLRHLRDSHLKGSLYVISNGLAGNNGAINLARLNHDLEMAGVCEDITNGLSGKGKKDWDRIKEKIILLGRGIADEGTKNKLRAAFKRMADASKGRTSEIRKAVTETRRFLLSSHPAYLAGQLSQANEEYLSMAIAFLNEAAKALEQKKLVDSFRLLRAAQNEIPS